jgi:two-component system, LytTR family, sensor kinase
LANPTINTATAPAAPMIGSYFTSAGGFKKRVLYHALFWVVYCLFIMLMFFSFYRIQRPGFYFQLLIFFPLEIVLVYINFYVLMPRLLFAQKYVKYGLALLAGIIVLAFINTLWQVMYAKMGYKEFVMNANFKWPTIVGRVMEMFYLIGFTSGVKLARNWMFHLQWVKEKEKQYLETELNFLKTQIQPHFFFNTLNNLYSLTLKKSDQAPEVVLKLSDLMSYMLYESGAGRVALDKEIAYLQNYIEVEKLRFGQRLDVHFETQGDTENIFIPPMVLILFLENSFKHGVKNNVHHITITISLKVENNSLYFRVANPVSMEAKNPAHEGIGLKNVRRRLDLLFGKNYTLDTVEKDNQYIVSLKMPVW